MEYFKFIMIGFAGGTLSGLLGIGGGFIVIPLLLYLTGTEAKAATAISMVQTFFSSLSGSIFNYFSKTIKVKYALYFGITSMGFSFAGSFLTKYLSDSTIKIIYLGAIILSLILFILRICLLCIGKAEDNIKIEDAASERKRILKVIPLGIIAGFLGGILGVGGGFLYVPLLVLFLDLSLKIAVATSLMIIIFNSAIGLIGKLVFIDFNYITALIIAISSIAGSRLGTYINQKVRPTIIRITFILLLLFMIGRVAIDLGSRT